MTRRLCTLACIVLAAVTAVALAGCGSSKKDPDATSILNTTFGSKGAAVNSGTLKLAVDANVKGVSGLNGPIKLGLTGPFQSAAKDGDLPRFDFTLSLTSSGSTLVAGAISTGDKGFLKFQGTSFSITDKLFAQFKSGYASAQKSSASKDSSTNTLASLGIDPRRWLVDPKKTGKEDVGGVSTYHVDAGIAVPKLLADLDTVLQKARTAAPGASSRITPAQQKKILAQVVSANVAIWSGVKDERLRKFVIDVRLKTGTVRVSLELDGLGEPVNISAPANPRPLDDLLAAVQGDTTGTTTTPATPTTTAPTATTPSTGANSPAYLTCVQKAGQDIAKLQACAKLLAG